MKFMIIERYDFGTWSRFKDGKKTYWTSYAEVQKRVDELNKLMGDSGFEFDFVTM